MPLPEVNRTARNPPPIGLQRIRDRNLVDLVAVRVDDGDEPAVPVPARHLLVPQIAGEVRGSRARGGVAGQVYALVIVQNAFAIGEMEEITRHGGVSLAFVRLVLPLRSPAVTAPAARTNRHRKIAAGGGIRCGEASFTYFCVMFPGTTVALDQCRCSATGPNNSHGPICQTFKKCPRPRRKREPDTAHKAAEVHAPATVVAAWPSGVSQLAQAVNACQRRDAGIDWLQRRPGSIVLPPAFFRA